jgi:prophage regulatory protein
LAGSKSHRLNGRRNLIRKSDVRTRVNLSDSHIWRLEKNGNFPARVRLGPNAVAWYEDEVDDWIESRPRAGGTQPPLPKNRRKHAPEGPSRPRR